MNNGIEEENCQIFSEDFLLLSTASGQTNVTLARGQVVVPELPGLLTAEEAKVVVDHNSQADGTFRTLDSIVGRSLAVRQHEISLRELLEIIQKDRYTRHFNNWLIVGTVVILSILISYLTSTYWLRPLLEFASRFLWRRPELSAVPPQPKRRNTRTCTLSTLQEGSASDATDAANALISTPVYEPTTSAKTQYGTSEEPNKDDLTGAVPVTQSMRLATATSTEDLECTLDQSY
jgi:hypothetical protein